MKDSTIKHLEMIQAVISRLNANSFQIKSGCIGIVSILMAAYASTGKPLIILMGIFPSIIGWLMDGFYLHKERGFRALYNRIITDSDSVTEFSMEIEQCGRYIGSLFSPSMLIYAASVAVIVLLYLIVV